eukprot:2785774-Karenia_brevis.AAC.1
MLRIQLGEAEKAIGAWTAHCGRMEDALRWQGGDADLSFRVEVLERRLDKVVKGTDSLHQTLGRAMKDSNERLMLWEANFLRVSNFEEKLDLFRCEIQKSLDALYQGFLSQLPGIFHDCAEALLHPKGSITGCGLVTIDEEVESAVSDAVPTKDINRRSDDPEGGSTLLETFLAFPIPRIKKYSFRAQPAPTTK